jgi:hypothetical protein
MNDTRFLAVMTHDPQEAINLYEKKYHVKPTVILIRPDFSVTFDHPLIVRSRFCSWGVMLLTHTISPREAEDNTDFFSIAKARESIEPPVDIKKLDLSIPSFKPGRPIQKTAICPHCHNKIKDFETLGFWYGWQYGIDPPYWDELRAYVMRRDNYKCQKCHKIFPPSLLQVHHINAKETGGEDGARNLTTLCKDCHGEHKPIFEDVT